MEDQQPVESQQPVENQQPAEEKLTETYNAAVIDTQEMGQAHENGLKAVWDRAVAETHKLRDELGGAVAGVDIEALKAENERLTQALLAKDSGHLDGSQH